MSKLKRKECAGCGKEFTVLPLKEENSLYCTPTCEESHDIFISNK